jgi:hypothetical protein
MTLETMVAVIGVSHLLQPPLTMWLARDLGFQRAFSELSPLAAQVARNMATASVFLPTSIGIVIAAHARDVLAGGAPRLLGLVIAAFWSWRLFRQVHVLGPLWPTWPSRVRRWHWVLMAIFLFQGPVLAAVLCAARLSLRR